MTEVINQRSQMAIITKDVSIDEVKRVCRCGFTMPQKSTFFIRRRSADSSIAPYRTRKYK